MDKQKVRPLDEERESRSLLSNAVVILHLILGTLPILLVVWAVDKLINGTLPSIIVWGIGGIMILFAMLRGVFYGTSIWRAHRSAYNALTRLRLRIISHLQRLPLGFFQERKVGDLVNIINHDVEQIEIYLAHGLPEILSATLSCLTLGNHYGVGLAFGAVAHFSFACSISSANGCQNTLGKELSTLYGKYAKNVGRPFGICGYHIGNQSLQ